MEFDAFRQLVMDARTVRRFDESRSVSVETLKRLVELVRYCPSGRNAQPLRYVLITSEEKRSQIFPLLKWAGYYTDWDGPSPGERPVAYLIQCLDTNYGQNCLCDDGLQLEVLNLGMRILKLGGCIIKAFDHVTIKKCLELPEQYEPRYVFAIGYPAEEVRLENMNGSEDADFKYYRTDDNIHHVPKRPLIELIIKAL